jgi:hypothetical protein
MMASRTPAPRPHRRRADERHALRQLRPQRVVGPYGAHADGGGDRPAVSGAGDHCQAVEDHLEAASHLDREALVGQSPQHDLLRVAQSVRRPAGRRGLAGQTTRGQRCVLQLHNQVHHVRRVGRLQQVQAGAVHHKHDRRGGIAAGIGCIVQIEWNLAGCAQVQAAQVEGQWAVRWRRRSGVRGRCRGANKQREQQHPERRQAEP